MSHAQPLYLRSKSISRSQAIAALGLALAAAGVAPVLIRMAQGAGVPSLAIAPIRLILATAILTPIIFRHYRKQIRQLSFADVAWSCAAGFWLTISFAAFFSALEHTSMLVANVLDGTTPLWVITLEMIFLRAQFRHYTWIGLTLALAGGFMITVAGSSGKALGDNPMLGIILATADAFAFSIYAVIGRKSRQRIGFIPYIWMVFFSAAVTAASIALLTHTSLTGYSVEGYFWVGLLTIVAQLVFHPSYNFALKYLPATFMSILGQMSVVIAVILGMIVFGETTGWIQLTGGALILTGVTLASLEQNRRPR